MSEEQEPKEKKKWYSNKKNWGFWVLIIGFIAFLITWFIVKPLVGG